MDDFTWLLPRDDKERSFTWWLLASTLVHLSVFLVSTLVIPAWPDTPQQFVTWATMVDDVAEPPQEEPMRAESSPDNTTQQSDMAETKPAHPSPAPATPKAEPPTEVKAPSPPEPPAEVPEPAEEEGINLLAEKKAPPVADPPKPQPEKPAARTLTAAAPTVTYSRAVQQRISSAAPPPPKPVARTLTAAAPTVSYDRPAPPPPKPVARQLAAPAPTVTYSRPAPPAVPPKPAPRTLAAAAPSVSYSRPTPPPAPPAPSTPKPAARTLTTAAPSVTYSRSAPPAATAPTPTTTAKPSTLASLLQSAVPAVSAPPQQPKPAAPPEVVPAPPPPKPPPVISIPSGEIKLELTAGDDLPRETRVVVHFRPYAKRFHSRPMTKAEASQSKVLVPQMVRPKPAVLAAVLETAAEGVYDFRLEGWKGDGGPDVVCTLYENGPGARTKKLGKRVPAANGSIGRLLMPEGIFWDDENAFQGTMESSDSVTRFNSTTGLVWREYR